MLADRREAVHANADGGHVALLSQLGGTLGDVFRRALEQVLHHARRAVARARGGLPDFRFGLCEIGAFSSLLCWFCGLGCGKAALRKRLRLGPPGVAASKNPRRFWGALRPPNEKPGAVSRAGLGHTPEGYLFIHESRFNVQKSQVAVTSCTEVTSCTTHRLYPASQEIFVGHPPLASVQCKARRGFPAGLGHTFRALLLTFPRIFDQGCIPPI